MHNPKERINMIEKQFGTGYGPPLQRDHKTSCITSLQAEIDRLGGVPYGWMKIYEVLLFAFYNPRTGMHEFIVESREPSIRHRLTRNMFDAWLRRRADRRRRSPPTPASRFRSTSHGTDCPRTAGMRTDCPLARPAPQTASDSIEES